MKSPGFSLIESLVAITIGSLLVILVSRTSSMILISTRKELNHVYAQIELATILDRIAEDISRSEYISYKDTNTIICQSSTQRVSWRMSNDSCTRTVLSLEGHNHQRPIAQSLYHARRLECLGLRSRGRSHVITVITSGPQGPKRFFRCARSASMAGEL